MPESLYALALLACPLGMGAMMWMMMRGNKSSDVTGAAEQAELTAMRARIDQLEADKNADPRPEEPVDSAPAAH